MRRTTWMGIVVSGLMVGAMAGCGSGGAGEWKLAVQTYTFNRFTLMEAIEKADALGLKDVEGFAWQKVGGEHGDVQLVQADDAVRDAVKRKLDDAGIRMLNCYFQLPNDEAKLRETFAFCKQMGIETIVGEPPAEAFDLMDALTAEYGVNLAVHNHPRHPEDPSYTFWKPENVMKLLDGRNPRMGACADTGHWARSGLDPAACLKIYDGRLISLHLKDVNERGAAGHDVPFGTGVSDVRGQLAELDRQRFSGVIAIEYENNMQDNMADVAACIAFVGEFAK